jgi:hypothetical protein
MSFFVSNFIVRFADKFVPSIKANKLARALQHHAVESRRWLTALMTKLKSEGFTTLAAVNPQMHPSQELQAILDLFDGEINIFEKQTEKGSERFLKIKRMSDQKYLENEILLTRSS